MATKKKRKMPRLKIRYEDEMEEWDMRPDLGETDKTYKYFCAYRDMNVQGRNKRSIREVQKQFDVQLATIAAHSRRFRWVERAKAYDKYLEKSRRARFEDELIRMYATHAKVGTSLIAKAMQKLINTPDDMLTINDVTKLLDLGLKTERISRGESIEGKLRNEKLEAEIRNLNNSGDGTKVEIVDDIPPELDGIDDIPLDK